MAFRDHTITQLGTLNCFPTVVGYAEGTPAAISGNG